MHLDCDELFSLKFEDEELEYCVNSLRGAISSPDFKADGISVNEFLQILTGITHPSFSTMIKTSATKAQPKKKEKHMILSYFDQRMIEVAEELVKNSYGLIGLNIISLLESILGKNEFQTAACKLLWNLLHQEGIKCKVLSDHSGVCKALEALKTSKVPDDQLSSHCSLWLLGRANEKGNL